MVPGQCSVTFCHKSKCVSERNFPAKTLLDMSHIWKKLPRVPRISCQNWHLMKIDFTMTENWTSLRTEIKYLVEPEKLQTDTLISLFKWKKKSLDQFINFWATSLGHISAIKYHVSNMSANECSATYDQKEIDCILLNIQCWYLEGNISCFISCCKYLSFNRYKSTFIILIRVTSSLVLGPHGIPRFLLQCKNSFIKLTYLKWIVFRGLFYSIIKTVLNPYFLDKHFKLVY